MKVLVFTTLYPNNIWPDQGIFIRERMTHFASLKNCQVKVVAPVPYFPRLRINRRWMFSQIAKTEVIDGIQVYHPRYFISPKVGMAFYGLMMFLSIIPTIRHIRKNFNFDLIDGHYIYPDGFAAVLFGRVFRKPVVLSARGSDINLFAEFPVIRRLLRLALNKADKIIAVSEALKEAMVRLGICGEKIHVIRNGINPKHFHPLPKQQARQRISIPSDKVLILSVGNLSPNKGMDLLIKALAILVDELPEKNFCLVIVGDGILRPKLEKLTASLDLTKHVYFAGHVPHEELLFWYNAADVFCLASAREGTPNVLLESLACGTPVVATRVGGIPEVVTSEFLGLLMNRTERGIADAICRVLERRWQRTVMLRYAREHTWAGVADAIFEVFESVLRGGHSSSEHESRQALPAKG
jgi:teichuronic acid biosynthesis glycosyltransferase TuaC